MTKPRLKQAMADKAWENLEAAERLLEGTAPCTNASTSRAYYAAYQACWAAMVSAGHSVPTLAAGAYFPHKTLPTLAEDASVLDDLRAEDLRLLEGRRVKADYFEDRVSEAEADDSHVIAKELVSGLLPDVGEVNR